MKKLIIIAIACIVGGLAVHAASLSRVKIGAGFGSTQARVLNNVISEAETAITANTTALAPAPVALSVTNGATISPTATVYLVSGIGGANDTTNTVTLANATDGQVLTLIVSAASTNLITIADSGNAALSGAWLGDNNDVISLIGVSTNWVEVSASDN